ncbi:MAG TPA: glutamyl-tRNA reductase [Armatimonadetes bacterium]|nr:glutamyl-tRNA reductase [Armatimonadota bacterium]
MTELPHIIAAGLNHRSAPVELREQVAFRPTELEDALTDVVGRPHISEAVILSTCNRSELYAMTTRPEPAVAALGSFLADFHGLDPAELEPHVYRQVDAGAIRHLFEVAAGLDSMVLGEGQILAQVKQALAGAAGVGTAGACLNELFQRALRLGKQARTDTEIGRGAMSISSAAVDLARTTFGELAGREVLVVGAGEMSRQTLIHLRDQGVRSVIVANRTYDHAHELATEFGGQAIRFDDFAAHLGSADIVVSSSAAPHAIITADGLRPVLAERRGRPLFIVDIAVPRDVEAAVAELDDVYLFDIDDLNGVCDRYRAERAREAQAVAHLVEAEAVRFGAWLQARAVTPLVTELRERHEALCEQELERGLRRLTDLTPAQRQQVERMMRDYTHKVLHGPVTGLRELAAERGAGRDWTGLVRRLFGLRNGPQPIHGEDEL